MKNVSYLFLAIQSTEKKHGEHTDAFSSLMRDWKGASKGGNHSNHSVLSAPKVASSSLVLSYLKSLSLSLSFIVDRANQLVFVWD
jgi:hypothetical protein